MATSKKVLITGASGLVGTHLTKMLLDRGYQVAHLGRERRGGPAKSFTWNVDQYIIEPGALDDVNAIIHLAGAGVADKPWTEKRKAEILNSRTRSTRLLYDELKKGNHKLDVFISASGIAYYGFEDSIVPYSEEDPHGEDYLADVTVKWEAEVDRIAELTRVCKVRTGIGLSEKGGALPMIMQPIKLFVGSPLGSGKQMMNWIHLDDLCGIYIRALEDESFRGAYNAVAPNPVNNKEFTKAIARAIHKPLWLPAVPSFVMKILLGDMAYIVLKGGAVSSKKVQREGYEFKYTRLDDALNNLLSTAE
jgi:uncharacterized protein